MAFLGDGRRQEGAQAEPVLVEVFRVALQPRRKPGPGNNLQPQQCRQPCPLPRLQSDPAVRQCHRHRAARAAATSATAAAATTTAAAALPSSSQFRVCDVDAAPPAAAAEHREGERHRVHASAAAADDEHDHPRPQSDRVHSAWTGFMFHSVSLFSISYPTIFG